MSLFNNATQARIWAISLLSGVLFIAAAVKVWGVASDEVLGYLFSALLLLGFLMLSGLLVGWLAARLRRRANRD